MSRSSRSAFSPPALWNIGGQRASESFGADRKGCAHAKPRIGPVLTPTATPAVKNSRAAMIFIIFINHLATAVKLLVARLIYSPAELVRKPPEKGVRMKPWSCGGGRDGKPRQQSVCVRKFLLFTLAVY